MCLFAPVLLISSRLSTHTHRARSAIPPDPNCYHRGTPLLVDLLRFTDSQNVQRVRLFEINEKQRLIIIKKYIFSPRWRRKKWRKTIYIPQNRVFRVMNIVRRRFFFFFNGIHSLFRKLIDFTLNSKYFILLIWNDTFYYDNYFMCIFILFPSWHRLNSLLPKWHLQKVLFSHSNTIYTLKHIDIIMAEKVITYYDCDIYCSTEDPMPSVFRDYSKQTTEKMQYHFNLLRYISTMHLFVI